jgi:hypothetical protein
LGLLSERGDSPSFPPAKTEEFILVDEDAKERLSRAKSDVALFENRSGVVREYVEGSDG